MDWLQFWDFTSADWAGLTFVLVFVALIVAWSEARAAARLREAETRPFVTIDLHSDKSHIIFLTVANIGRSMARDVTFAIEPKLESKTLPTIPRLKMLDPNGGIASLPPGKTIKTAFDVWPQRAGAGLPDMYEATAEYDGEQRRRFLFWKRPRHYRDPPITLDLGIYRDGVPEQRKDMHDVHAVLVQIKKTLARSGRQAPPDDEEEEDEDEDEDVGPP